jgi:reactive intermediate/imine deaminase
MKTRLVTLATLFLVAATCFAAGSDRKHIMLPRSATTSTLPFSDGVLIGDTLYIAGHLGVDPKTDKPAEDTEQEARLVMDEIQKTVEAAGMTMDDLVSIQVFCSDVSLYDTFNKVYRTYFHGEYPARAFLGSGKLLRGARFEVLGIAVKKSK